MWREFVKWIYCIVNKQLREKTNVKAACFVLFIACVLSWREFDVWRHEFANFLKFANTSLQTLVCRVKAA